MNLRALLTNLCLLLLFAGQAQTKKTVDQRVDSLLRLMTLDEKIGQMNQYSGPWAHTGPITEQGDLLQQVRNGQLGSLLNVTGVEHTRELQAIALQSRLHIPLLFGQDVIHGYRTTFPIPLAEAASWDLNVINRSARVAATEAAAAGLHWTFAPMVDIARDPRWGRVMEGAGEDPWLGAAIAKARVQGFQKNLGDTDAVMACVKHFAAYGAAIGGRDYNSVDMSERTLWEVYLPPFKAAADAGAATFMNSFNDLNGTPATASKMLQRDILKNKWHFTGFIVSDWGSIGEMIAHGHAADSKEAGLQAVLAGNDMDMESRSYIRHLAALVREKRVSITVIDEAVRRILRKKFELGLFDDPYKYCNAAREQRELNNPAHAAAARDVARRSIVLLKNEGNVLPLPKTGKTVAFIGPLVKSVRENLGFWSIEFPDSAYIVSQWDGVRNRLGPGGRLLYARGCGIDDTSHAGFDEAIATARQADVVVLSIGERRDMSGEAKSRSNIHLPGVQEELVKALVATGKPVVVVINAGRPLVFGWTAAHAPAIVYSWWLGSEAGNALADVLFGDYNPSGHLPMSFPRSEGQIPIYYNHYNTGRPAQNDSDRFYRSAYLDESIYPQYPFGYGLSYTSFSYSNLRLSDTLLKTGKEFMAGGSITVSCTITNTGRYAGEEVVQLYIRDRVAQPLRPVKELKGFEKILLQPGASKTVQFTIGRNELSCYNDALQWVAPTGVYDIMIGASSEDIRLRSRIELRDATKTGSIN